MQLFVPRTIQILKISSFALFIGLMGCATEPFVTDEGSAAAQHADRQNIEFQEKGVPRRPVDKKK